MIILLVCIVPAGFKFLQVEFVRSVTITLFVLIWQNTASGANWRVASKRLRVPLALTSKSKNGMAAARS